MFADLRQKAEGGSEIRSRKFLYVTPEYWLGARNTRFRNIFSLLSAFFAQADRLALNISRVMTNSLRFRKHYISTD
jgi:hypothetical protein